LKRILLLALLLAGCENVLGIRTSRFLAEGGTCTGTLRVRVLYDMTGSTKDVGIPAGKGVHDHLLALQKSGGLRGCPIDVEIADTKYDVQTTIAAYRAWAARPDFPEVSTIFVQGTPMAEALGPLAAQDGKIVVSTAFNGALAAPAPVQHDVGVPTLNGSFALATLPVQKKSPGYPFVFFQGTDYTTSARVAMNVAWKRGAKRMGFFACTTSAFCTDPVDGAKTFIPLLGTIQVGRDLPIELDDDEPTIAQKVAVYFQAERDHAAQDASYVPVDWIWFGNTRRTLALVGKALAAVPEHPQIITDNWGLDEALRAECGDACTGVLGVQPFPAYGDLSASGMQRLIDIHDAQRKADNEPTAEYAQVQYVYGYVATLAWRTAVESAIDAGQQPTGATLRAAFESWNAQPLDGLASVTYTPSDHRPQSSARLYQLDASGKLTLVGQPISISLQPDWLGY